MTDRMEAAMSVEAPERIWIESEGECPYFYLEEELSDVAPPVTEYVRADKLRAEIDALLAEALRELEEREKRDEALLRQALEALKAENEMLRESLKDADNELDWLDEDVDTCDHSVGVCMCSYWSMRRKMKAALASQRGNADIALLVFAVVCAVWLVIAGAMGWLPGCGL